MSVTQIPWALIECTLFVLIVYFFVGFYKGAGELLTLIKKLLLARLVCMRSQYELLCMRAWCNPRTYKTSVCRHAAQFFTFYLLCLVAILVLSALFRVQKPAHALCPGPESQHNLFWS